MLEHLPKHLLKQLLSTNPYPVTKDVTVLYFIPFPPTSRTDVAAGADDDRG